MEPGAEFAELAGLVGESPGIVAVREMIQRLLPRLADAQRPPPILIQGETGTGKGLLARAIHRARARRTGPFVDVNCAAIPETMLEAELFGFERGAFTDARHAKPGLFQAAHHGSLFLDELGLQPPMLQGKLLTVLEDRVVRRLGSTRGEPVDVWIVAANDVHLKMTDMASAGVVISTPAVSETSATVAISGIVANLSGRVRSVEVISSIVDAEGRTIASAVSRVSVPANEEARFAHPEVRRRNTFCYIDARDLGQIVHLCLEKDGLGFQVFNCGNDTNTANIPTAEILRRFYPGVPVTRPLGEFEALYSNRKIREILGFREEHDWRKYVKG